ncbi:Uncharacterised protein [Vibrio cholerae]|nr:Uncharacterised protein [Vibrio cholerae]
MTENFKRVTWIGTSNRFERRFKRIRITVPIFGDLLHKCHCLTNASESDGTVVNCVSHVNLLKIDFKCALQ